MRPWVFALFVMFEMATLNGHLNATEAKTLVFVWGPINNRVLQIAEIQTDSDSGLITEVRLYDNSGVRRPSTTDYAEQATLVREHKLVTRTDRVLEYMLIDSQDQQLLRFVVTDEQIVVTGDGFEHSRRIVFHSDSLGYEVYTGSVLAYQLRAEQESLRLVANELETQYIYTGEVLDKVSRRYKDTVPRIASVDGASSGHIVVEMPSYGDPGEFSHRIELWPYEMPRVTLESAAINSYILPSSIVSLIFPFFAPTPQEILEQAAATE